MKCGLIGRKLSHSYSPKIHSYFSNYEYKLYELEPNELESFMKSSDLDAFNVTIPYKKDVIPYCNKLSVGAERIGAVNTIIKEKDGTLSGYNTDYYGFLYMLNSTDVGVKGKKAIILGSGGASLTCQVVLKDLGASEVVVISRNSENNYNNLNKHFNAEVIVNATPVGMYPNIDQCPVSLNVINNSKVVMDIIFNPKITKLLEYAKSNINGLYMLVLQAIKAEEIWQNQSINLEINELLTRM